MKADDMSIEQLKSMAYDEIAKVNIAQQNLQTLNQLIQKKQEDRINSVQKVPPITIEKTKSKEVK